MVCETCGFQNLLPYHKYEKAASSGCKICGAIVKSIEQVVDHHRLYLNYNWKSHLSVGPKATTGKESIDLVFCALDSPNQTDSTKHPSQFNIEIFVDKEGFAGPAEKASRFPFRRHVHSDCFPFLKQSLDHCMRNHNCGLHPDYLPKRLIDVSNTTSEDTVKLIDNADQQLPLDTRYVALSYCWGDGSEAKSRILTMDKSKLQEMTDGIKMTTLPPVFYDAVAVTRALGMHHLWIDALCIAQGDAEEWKVESAKMKSVYSKASVTLIAAAAASCVESFLPDPAKRSEWTSIPVPLYPGSSDPGLFVRRHVFSPHKYQIDSRGWCMQELLLSRRVIYFQDSDVIFTCGHGIRSETGQPVLLSQMYRAGDGIKLQKQWTRQLEDNSDNSLASATDLWHRVVQKYSQRNLTNDNDKLPALSGLASQHKTIGREPHDIYLAGLWKSSLIHDLGWEARKPPRNQQTLSSTSMDQLQITTFPSWSWISVTREINYHSLAHPAVILTGLVDHTSSATIDTNHLDDFSEIINSRLTLRGPCFGAQAIGVHKDLQLKYRHESPHNSRSSLPENVIPPMAHEPLMLDVNVATVAGDANSDPVLVRAPASTTSTLQHPKPLFQCLILGCRINSGDGFQPLVLALAPAYASPALNTRTGASSTGNDHQKLYRRIGIFLEHWRFSPPVKNVAERERVIRNWAASFPSTTVDII